MRPPAVLSSMPLTSWRQTEFLTRQKSTDSEEATHCRWIEMGKEEGSQGCGLRVSKNTRCDSDAGHTSTKKGHISETIPGPGLVH